MGCSGYTLWAQHCGYPVYLNILYILILMGGRDGLLAGLFYLNQDLQDCRMFRIYLVGAALWLS